MFGIGSTELLIIVVVALLVIGPQKLPGLMRSLGKGLAEFKRVGADVKHTLDREVELAEQEERKKEAKKKLFPEKAKAESESKAESKAEPGSEAAEPEAGPESQTKAGEGESA
ncbi:MAG: Sec-independent protein translocase protein TatB [Desulfovibrionaceae bacterium]|nr:Sec-independent protein translocase protein TatB [Desulfovibrionaceae bacterium]